MTFVEFVASHEAGDQAMWLEHWRRVLPPMLQGTHDGGCVGQPQTCVLCWLEEMLREYRIEVTTQYAIDYLLTDDGSLTAGELRQQVRRKFGADVDDELRRRYGT